jgi:ribosomal protein S18 acetylase RimI-like enzyme
METERFGVICAQEEFPNSHLEDINEAVYKKAVSMMSMRVDVADIQRIHALENDGYRLMDTLVYYGGSLENLKGLTTLPNGIVVRMASVSDKDAVSGVAQEVFRNYIGHYHSDLRIDNAAADQAYIQWAENSISNVSDDMPVLIAEEKGEVVGFLTMQLNTPEKGEIILNGVHPDHQCRGVYSSLFEQSKYSLAEIGAKRIIISTQINNYAVQKVWARSGFVHEQSYYTFHKWYD